MKAECQSSQHAAAHASHELPPDEALAYEAHLALCPACREEMTSMRGLLGKLRSLEQPVVSRDLAPVILAKLHQAPAKNPHTPAWPRWVKFAAAAAVAVFAGLGTLWLSRDVPKAPLQIVEERTVQQRKLDALQWFCRNQEPDGSWNAEKWGGNRRFEVALTALPLLALLSNETLTTEQETAARRALAFLQSRQADDGTFGPVFRERPFVQSVSTLAMLHAYKRWPGEPLKKSIDTSLGVILTGQTNDGAWGYTNSPVADRAITRWQIETLEHAAELGWPKVMPSLARATVWYTEQATVPTVPDDIHAIPENANEELDYHSAYVLASSLRQKTDNAAHQRLATIQSVILAHQAQGGPETGSWPPTDQWSRVGGRIYTTALASMALP